MEFRSTKGSYGLHVCVPQNSYVEILTLKGDDVSRWGLWEMI